VIGLQLKFIELQGFKSFPEKTRLAFEKPVTVIVGPNGSGKSNIADALLWVMGEQSTRTLRGGKMEDVIFGGTQRRAQVGFAEVSLILDNSDGTLDIENSEVMITRRYYRSGESEYYINRKMSRLKDIHELLMDTGLGREGYSVIGQGKIGDILSEKSKDRRVVFEEAVGISRYRHRKEEAERKLSQTDENLLRINDKISELELQLDPLREQSETARRYLLLRDELRGLEISLWVQTLEKTAAKIIKVTGDHLAATMQLSGMESELESAYKRSETYADRLREKDVAAEEKRESVTEKERLASERESAVAALKTRLENNLVRIDGINSDVSQQQNRDGGIDTQLSEREERVKTIDAQRGELERSLTDIENTLSKLSDEATNEENELFALSERERGLVDTLSNRRERLSALAQQAQELLDRDEALSSEISRESEEIDAQNAELLDVSAQSDKARDEDTQLQNVVNGFLMRVNSRREKSAEAEERKTRLSMELHAMKSRIAMLTEMENEYQGYSKAVRLVMSDASRGILKNVYGAVAGLIKASDKYAVAIETALGGNMQSIIVGSEADGKAAINMLKRRDGGRATFLPVSTIRGNVLRESGLDDEDGFEGVAVSLISFAPEYEGIYNNLLGRTAIVETLDDAIRIAKKYSNRFRIVTLDGQVINAGGSMTGGSVSKNSGILSRANELKQLSAREKLLTDELTGAETQFAERARELSAAEYELETARIDKRAVENRLIELQSECTHIARSIEEKENALSQRRVLREAISGRIGENSDEIVTTREEIARAETSVGEVRGELIKRGEGRERVFTKRDEAIAASSELRANAAALDAERSAVVSALGELRAIRADLQSEREAQLLLADRLREESDAIRAEILDNERARETIIADADALRAEIAAITRDKLAIEAERTDSDRETRERNKELLDLERECARLEQQKITMELEEKQIVDKLWDNYEISRVDAYAERRELDSVQAAGKRVSEIKREISKLGNPNIGAIEEFERVNTRYSYLSEQRDDVFKAKRELDTIIGDITEQMREIFSREFCAIEASFSETFTELFGGGKASLILEDPDDILNCGIEIEAQPPGKSLKTLMLLSGGERAFVAIALYFAIMKVRPSPFVVLDEIEAALDDANVTRFAAYMRQMSSRTQLIVISHRRGTMEEADTLYGVTMQEQGVSRILSIDLDEAQRVAEEAERREITRR
jgi:chromosome segregation protein